MSNHVAILLKPYIKLILEGRKTIESRLTMTARPPYRAIAPGERIYFKVSAGPYMATAVADRVEFYDGLTVHRLRELFKRYNARVCGDAAYWQWKRHSRFATFIYLRDVEATGTGPAMAPSRGIAWFVLPGSGTPRTREHRVTLTAGAIRNRYLRVDKLFQHVGRPIALAMPDGESVQTRVLSNRMIQWRGWGAYYQRHALAAGDVVRLVERAPGGYRVEFSHGR